MAKARKIVPEINELTASIEQSATSYSISDYRLAVRRIDDEALLEITAQIETIGGKHSSLVGSPIFLTLGSSKSYSAVESSPLNGLPSLFSLTFKKGGCSALVYLPSDVFWGLRSLISGGEIKRVGISYGKPRYGSADLITLAFD